MPDLRRKRWLLTIKLDEAYSLIAFRTALDTVMNENIEFAVWQHERGAEGGYNHIQAALFLKRVVSMRQLKADLGAPHAHCESIRKPEEAIKYCEKEDTRVEGPWYKGERPLKGQGHRSDLDELAQGILDGHSMYALAQEFPRSMLLHSAHAAALAEIVQCGKPPCPPRTEEDAPTVVYLFGPTGTGKSRFVRDFCKHHGLRLWQYAGDGRFCGYAGQEAALFDDWRWSDLPRMGVSTLLRLTDRYPETLPARYRNVSWTPWYVFFTSNEDIPSPGEIPEWPMVTYEAFLRRVTHLREFIGPGPRKVWGGEAVLPPPHFLGGAPERGGGESPPRGHCVSPSTFLI